MIREIMEDVKTAEQKAADLVENAKLHALSIENDAKAKAEQYAAEEWKKQSLRAQDALLFAKTKGDEYAAGVKKETQKQLDALKRNVSEKEEGAIRLVLENLI